MSDTSSIDYRYLSPVEKLIERAPAFTKGGIRYWIFWAKKNGLDKALIKIDRNVYVDIRAFNRWLSEGKNREVDYRKLRTIKQVLQTSHIKESKLRHWLQYAKFNGLEQAIVRKNPRKLLIDIECFNTWLANRNSNNGYRSVMS
tara:strand:+ start:4007 stop:4438 length:432 start_codon:yes stop_codon:yes gene_type:complete